MKNWSHILIICLLCSCTEKWSESQQVELDKLTDGLVQNIELSNRLTLSELEFLVDQNGRRPFDVEVLKEAKRVIQFLSENENWNGILDTVLIEKRRLQELDELLDRSVNHEASLSPLQKSMMLEEVVAYYAMMVGGNCICFDEPRIKLLRSLEDTSKYKVIAGGSLPDREYAVVGKDKNALDVVDPFLVERKMNVDWEQIDSKRLIYHVPED